MANRIGIFGGTFSPMHLGHLAVARVAADEFSLDKVFVVPAKVNPFRTDDPPALADELRLECVRITCEGDSRLVPDDIEIRRGGVSYAVDTVREIRAQNPGAEVFWIMGADSLPGLAHWHEAEKLFGLCSFIVYPRTGSNPRSCPLPQNCKVFFLQGELKNVSSTEIRNRLKNNQSLDGLAAPGILPLLNASFHAIKQKRPGYPSLS